MEKSTQDNGNKRSMSLREITNEHNWVRFYRIIYETEEWKELNSVEREMFLFLLQDVNIKRHTFQHRSGPVDVKAGQTVTTNSNLAKAVGDKISTDSVRRILVKLQNAGFITYQTFTNKYTIININRWEELYGKRSGNKAASPTAEQITTERFKPTVYNIRDLCTGFKHYKKAQ